MSLSSSIQVAKTKLSSARRKITNRLPKYQRKPKLNPGLRVQSFTVQPNTSTTILSAAIILSFGVIIGFSIPAVQLYSKIEENVNIPPSQRAHDGLMILMLQITIGIIFDIDSSIGEGEYGLIASLIYGWFFGGLVAALIFDHEGRRGPIYSAVLAVSVFFTFSFMFSVIQIVIFGGSVDVIPQFLQILSILALTLLFAVISIPLIVIAWFGYKTGGLINNAGT